MKANSSIAISGMNAATTRMGVSATTLPMRDASADASRWCRKEGPAVADLHITRTEGEDVADTVQRGPRLFLKANAR